MTGPKLANKSRFASGPTGTLHIVRPSNTLRRNFTQPPAGVSACPSPTRMKGISKGWVVAADSNAAASRVGPWGWRERRRPTPPVSWRLNGSSKPPEKGKITKSPESQFAHSSKACRASSRPPSAMLPEQSSTTQTGRVDGSGRKGHKSAGRLAHAAVRDETTKATPSAAKAARIWAPPSSAFKTRFRFLENGRMSFSRDSHPCLKRALTLMGSF